MDTDKKTATMPTGIELELLCACFYECIVEFYKDPGNMRKYREWYFNEHGKYPEEEENPDDR